jgi:hypothetical protein
MPFSLSGRSDMKYVFICTKHDPWKPGLESPDKSYFKTSHPDSTIKYDEGDYESRECPHCGHYFSVEIAR